MLRKSERLSKKGLQLTLLSSQGVLGWEETSLEDGNNGHTHSTYRPRRVKSQGHSAKNALMQLNEISKGCSTNCCLRPGRSIALLCDDCRGHGLLFEGSGPTKKKAKLNAAEKALRSCCAVPNMSEAHMPWPDAGSHSTSPDQGLS
ncbi:hypothetical protein FQN60_006788 [Etheostoma spectabile]|uniref:DRBM domain-containing protein n=1 Tax=Etheostoma spectabile TaxID=54343 RepID=A0A5J5CF83_9PERO|nr:hypothetical protein FQN60_006788 [Etheostoma spectabile]